MCITEEQMQAAEAEGRAAAAAKAAGPEAAAKAAAAATEAKTVIREVPIDTEVTKTEPEITTVQTIEESEPESQSESEPESESKPDTTSPYMVGLGIVMLGAACSFGIASTMAQGKV